MSGIYSFIKTQCLVYLPEPLLQAIKVRHYARTVRSFAREDEPDLLVVEHLVERGAVAVDVGANIGVYTRALSEMAGDTGRVISIEPIPQTYKILTRNVRTLGAANVETLHAAVSDRSSRVVMEVPRYETGGEAYYQAHIVPDPDGPAEASGNRRVSVRSVTLDHVLEWAGRVDFIKCDVEGHELACVVGAAATIRRAGPAWLIEVSDDPDREGSASERLFGVLRAEGYEPWFFDSARLQRREPGDHSTNYFFLRQEHLDRLERRAPHLLAAD